MTLTLFKIAGLIAAAILVVFLLYVLGLTFYYIGKYTIKEIKKGGADDDRDREP